MLDNADRHYYSEFRGSVPLGILDKGTSFDLQEGTFSSGLTEPKVT